MLCIQVVLEQAQLPIQAPAPTAVAAALTAPQVVSQSLKVSLATPCDQLRNLMSHI